MATLKEFVILAADDTLETATRLNLTNMIAVELEGMREAKRGEDLERVFVLLDKIRRISTNELITSNKPQMRRPYGILAGRTFDHIQAIVLHPDYQIPRGHP